MDWWCSASGAAETAVADDRLRLIRKLLLDRQATPSFRSCPYSPRPNDVIICGYYRSGTSWLQQILHQIRVHGDGDQNYDDIDEQVWRIPPYMQRLDEDLNADQPTPGPRLFQCHDCYEDAPMSDEPGTRYVVVVRDPLDSAWSEMSSRNRWLGCDKDFEPSAFVKTLAHQMPDRPWPLYYPTYWEHLLSWWPHRHREDVLWIHYEDLVRSLPRCVQLLSSFLNIPLSYEQAQSVCHYCSFDYMSTNARKFQGQHSVKQLCQMLCCPVWQPLVGRVRPDGGVVGQGQQRLPDEIAAQIRWNWRHTVGKLTGFSTYGLLQCANSILKPKTSSNLALELL